jgi:hypothetical protein
MIHRIFQLVGMCRSMTIQTRCASPHSALLYVEPACMHVRCNVTKNAHVGSVPLGAWVSGFSQVLDCRLP